MVEEWSVRLKRLLPLLLKSSQFSVLLFPTAADGESHANSNVVSAPLCCRNTPKKKRHDITVRENSRSQ